MQIGQIVGVMQSTMLTVEAARQPAVGHELSCVFAAVATYFFHDSWRSLSNLAAMLHASRLNVEIVTICMLTCAVLSLLWLALVLFTLLCTFSFSCFDTFKV